MKNVFCFFLLVAALSGYSQTDTVRNASDSSAIFMIADKMPLYPGGDDVLNEYVNSKVKIPWAYNGQKVFVKVTVEKDGTCSAELTLGIGNPRIDQAVVKAIASIRQWIPAEQNGIVVRAQRTIGIRLSRK